MSGLPNKSVCQHDVQAESADQASGTSNLALSPEVALYFDQKLQELQESLTAPKLRNKAKTGHARSTNATTASFQPVNRKND